MKNLLLSIVLISVLGCQTTEKKPSAADFIFTNGRVISMTSADAIEEAVAVGGEQILAVGTRRQVLKLRGPKTKVIDLKGKTVLPGLVEGHGHLYGLGAKLTKVDLAGVSEFNEILRRIKIGLESKKDTTQWVLGRGWDQNLWKNKKFPTASQLDSVVNKNPAMMTRIDGHAVWVNSVALKMAGIDKNTPNPVGGEIIRDRSGRATGVLLDKAIGLVGRLVPSTAKEHRKLAIERAIQLALQNGITTFHDAGVGPETLEIYQELASSKKLPIKLYVMLAGSQKRFLQQSIAKGPFQVGNLTVRSIKLMADGALGSRGAALLRPYHDKPSHSGLLSLNESDIFSTTNAALKAGFQVGTHAIGDRANREVINGYIRAIKANPNIDHRLRVEHAQILNEAEIDQFARWKIIASMQPTHCTSDSPWVAHRIGIKREKMGAYVWQRLLSSGAIIVSGSDVPVESINPFWGMYSAVTRKDHHGYPSAGWNPEQKMTLYQALKSYTVDAAYAGFAEEQNGKIAPGFYADLVVVDQRIGFDKFDERTLLKAKVLMTMVNGQVGYQALKAKCCDSN